LKKQDWFENWFNSPWYPILYQHRDELEAAHFVESLMHHIPLSPGASILDLACGNGRHARFLHSLGHMVLGVDLSENAIQFAQKSEKPGLSFRVGDMRDAQGKEEFDLVLNLFTSFGYFNSEEDNLQMLRSVRESLKKGGLFLLDFMNTTKVLKNLVPENQVIREGITFHLKRWLESGFIMKSITFNVGNTEHEYFERVQAIRKEDFFNYFKKCKMEVLLLSGDYALGPFDEENSDRMLFLVRKS
jgi:SAM-dependent methyltransferase